MRTRLTSAVALGDVLLWEPKVSGNVSQNLVRSPFLCEAKDPPEFRKSRNGERKRREKGTTARTEKESKREKRWKNTIRKQQGDREEGNKKNMMENKEENT